MFFLYFFSNHVKRKKYLVFLLLIIITASIYSLFFIHNIPRLAIFISSLMFAVVVFENGLDSYNMFFLMTCSVLLSFQVIYQSFQEFNYFRTGSLVLSYKNPNMAGIVLSNIVLILFVGFYYYKKKRIKVFFFFLSIYLIYLLFLTENRGSILAVLAAIFLIFLYRKGKKISNKLRITLIIIPIVILIIYIFLINYIPPDANIFGKPVLSGREIRWKYAIDGIINNPISGYSYGERTLNLLLWSTSQFGFLSVIFFFIFIVLLKPEFEVTETITFQKVAYICFLCIFIQQSFENTLTGGEYSVYIFSYLLIGIANTKIGLIK